MPKRPRPRDQYYIVARCATCGKTNDIIVERGTGRFIKDNGWKTWGKIQVNQEKTEQFSYVYEGLDGLTGKMKPSKKVKNPEYDPKVPRLFAEYWECGSCLKKSAKRASK